MTESKSFRAREKEYWHKIWRTLEELTNESKEDLMTSVKWSKLSQSIKQWGYVDCLRRNEEERNKYQLTSDEYW